MTKKRTTREGNHKSYEPRRESCFHKAQKPTTTAVQQGNHRVNGDFSTKTHGVFAWYAQRTRELGGTPYDYFFCHLSDKKRQQQYYGETKELTERVMTKEKRIEERRNHVGNHSELTASVR